MTVCRLTYRHPLGVINKWGRKWRLDRGGLYWIVSVLMFSWVVSRKAFSMGFLLIKRCICYSLFQIEWLSQNSCKPLWHEIDNLPQEKRCVFGTRLWLLHVAKILWIQTLTLLLACWGACHWNLLRLKFFCLQTGTLLYLSSFIYWVISVI